MGRTNNSEDHLNTIQWAEALSTEFQVVPDISPSTLRDAFIDDLRSYFALCNLSRSKTAISAHREIAYSLVFNARVKIEKKIIKSLKASRSLNPENAQYLFRNSIFGSSKKQGVSLRLPLASCEPTIMCKSGCYAHDVLDAAPNSVVRGAINGFIAKEYEQGASNTRHQILRNLRKHIVHAIADAEKEVNELRDFERDPYIRFSHVGEIAAYPCFANAIAREVYELSKGKVRCVTYSRHSKSQMLEPSLWIINFTIDPSSFDRLSLAPTKSRIVFSAWSGEAWNGADINFLEHHRWEHFSNSGDSDAKICPVTIPDTDNRTCDGVRCKACFETTT